MCGLESKLAVLTLRRYVKYEVSASSSAARVVKGESRAAPVRPQRPTRPDDQNPDPAAARQTAPGAERDIVMRDVSRHRCVN